MNRRGAERNGDRITFFVLFDSLPVSVVRLDLIFRSVVVFASLGALAVRFAFGF
jgi:hypothetical protein